MRRLATIFVSIALVSGCELLDPPASNEVFSPCNPGYLLFCTDE